MSYQMKVDFCQSRIIEFFGEFSPRMFKAVLGVFWLGSCKNHFVFLGQCLKPDGKEDICPTVFFIKI
jgi:hypothetical protein